MITINLLPEEYRKKARTPIKLMLAISAVVAINSGLIAYWGWLAFGVAAEVETDRRLPRRPVIEGPRDEDPVVRPAVGQNSQLEDSGRVDGQRRSARPPGPR